MDAAADAEEDDGEGATGAGGKRKGATGVTRRARASRRDIYSKVRLAKVLPFAQSGLGLTVLDLALGLKKENQSHRQARRVDVPDPPSSPEEVAFEFICPEFGTEESVMRATCNAFAAEIASHPAVKSYARRMLLDSQVSY